eukprot:s228_g56.t1
MRQGRIHFATCRGANRTRGAVRTLPRACGGALGRARSQGEAQLLCAWGSSKPGWFHLACFAGCLFLSEHSSEHGY